MEFVDIIGYEGIYKINRNGEIWSNYRNRLLKPHYSAYGYKRVSLSKNGKEKQYLIHRLIALNFIPNPYNLEFIDHINRVRNDNRIENLRWISHRNNCINQASVDNRKGHIQQIKYIRKDGTITITFKVLYNLKGEYGDRNKKSKSFKTLEEAEEFRKQNYK
jgi:hypothetical protein